jgi:predicted methyltransferase
VEALKLMVEYAVAVTVVGGEVTDKMTVWVVSDDLVTGGSVSVSITVVVAGGGTCVTVWSIVTTGRPPFPAAVEPPSTGTTEYVALLSREAGNVAWLGEKGNDVVNRKRVVKAQSAELETCGRMLSFALEAQLWESKLLIAAIKIERDDEKKKTYNEESGPV